MPDHVLGAEAVSHATDALAAQLGAHLDERGVDDRVDRGRQVAGWALEPFLHVEPCGPVQGDGVAVEEVRHDDEVAVGGELVGDELGVDEGVADHVGKDEDGVLGGFGGGVGEVGLDWNVRTELGSVMESREGHGGDD